jgi:hypothetical protein
MKALLVATLAFALVTAPAHAQGMRGASGAIPGSDGMPGGKHRRGTEQKAHDREKKTKVDDKGYRLAIDWVRTSDGWDARSALHDAAQRRI